jgi:hypothetical protein
VLHVPEVNTTPEPRQVEVGDVIRTLDGIVEEAGTVTLVTRHVAYFKCRKAGCSCSLPVYDGSHASHSVWRRWLNWEIVTRSGGAS